MTKNISKTIGAICAPWSLGTGQETKILPIYQGKFSNEKLITIGCWQMLWNHVQRGLLKPGWRIIYQKLDG